MGREFLLVPKVSVQFGGIQRARQVLLFLAFKEHLLLGAANKLLWRGFVDCRSSSATGSWFAWLEHVFLTNCVMARHAAPARGVCWFYSLIRGLKVNRRCVCLFLASPLGLRACSAAPAGGLGAREGYPDARRAQEAHLLLGGQGAIFSCHSCLY